MQQPTSPPKATEPFVVTIVETPAKETTFKDVVVGALGITGVLVLSALLLGAVLGGVFLLWHRRHRPEDEHLPPVVPTS